MIGYHHLRKPPGPYGRFRFHPPSTPYAPQLFEGQSFQFRCPTTWHQHTRSPRFSRRKVNHNHNKIKLGSIRKPMSSSESLPVASTVPSCCICVCVLGRKPSTPYWGQPGGHRVVHFVHLLLVFVFVFKEPIIFRSLCSIILWFHNMSEETSHGNPPGSHVFSPISSQQQPAPLLPGFWEELKCGPWELFFLHHWIA